MQRYVGIDIGGTNIKFGIFLNDGSLEKKWSISTDFSDEGKKMWDDIYNEIKKIHSYDCFEFAVYEFNSINSDYLKWIDEEVI